MSHNLSIYFVDQNPDGTPLKTIEGKEYIMEFTPPQLLTDEDRRLMRHGVKPVRIVSRDIKQ